DVEAAAAKVSEALAEAEEAAGSETEDVEEVEATASGVGDVEELAAVLSPEPAGLAEPDLSTPATGEAEGDTPPAAQEADEVQDPSASLAVGALEIEVVEAGTDENESVVESGPDAEDEGVRWPQ
ncbi:hypothetical protein ACFLYD_07145, partial [Chloroflexota bacterium]